MFKEFENHEDRLSYFLPWGILIEEGILLNKNGSFQTTLKFRGADLDSATELELLSNTSRLNNILKRIDGSWTLHFEAKRSKTKEYLLGKNLTHFPTKLIEIERKYFFESGNHYESDYYLTFTYFPPQDSTRKFFDFFIENNENVKIDYSAYLNFFKDETNSIFQMLADIFNEVEWLSSQELLTYLHTCVSDKEHLVAVPEIPILLDNFLCDTDLIGGIEPKLGKKHLRAISILSFPGSSIPGLLDNLNRLNMEYRWSTRFICMDKSESIKNLDSYFRKWFAGRKSMLQLVKEIFTNEESTNINLDAVNKSEEITTEKMILQGDIASHGYYTCSIIVMDEDLEILKNKVSSIHNTINEKGFTAKLETFNSIEAWIGTMPGNIAHNVRKPILNTLTLSHLLPISAVWSGDKINLHLSDSSLIYTQTTGNTPFRLNLHYNDIGHTMMVGPTGTGKSVHLAIIAAEFMKYKKSQVFIFDKGGSSMVLSKAMEGFYYDLGEKGLSFQPLAKIHIEKEREWCQEWIEELFLQEKILLTPAHKEAIWSALTSLSDFEVDKRTISSFSFLIQDKELRQGIAPYVSGGHLAKYFDSNEDNLNFGKWQVFEMEKISENKNAITLALSFLFHKIETERLDGSPTLIILDECWLFLDNPKFEAKIREWLKVLRKKNASVVFATQELSDIFNSKILDTVLTSCNTKIYLPNPYALGNQKEVYRTFGLNDKECERLALGIPKKEYYYKSPKGSRIYQLALSPLELAFVGASSIEDQNMFKNLEELPLRDFLIKWMEYKGLEAENIYDYISNFEVTN